MVDHGGPCLTMVNHGQPRGVGNESYYGEARFWDADAVGTISLKTKKVSYDNKKMKNGFDFGSIFPTITKSFY